MGEDPINEGGCELSLSLIRSDLSLLKGEVVIGWGFWFDVWGILTISFISKESQKCWEIIQNEEQFNVFFEVFSHTYEHFPWMN